MSDTHIEILQNMPIFGGIKKDILNDLLDTSDIVTVKRGDFFFHENEKGDFMFVLVEGKVAILKKWKEHDYLLSQMGVGDCFGEMELIDLQARSASALAETDCSAIRITTCSLHAVYKKNPQQFAMIHMNMGREVSRRLRVADEQVFKAKIAADVIDGHYVFKEK